MRVIKEHAMQSVTPRRRRARPVADAPVDALLDRTADLAKGWLLALLEDAPLGEAPTILAADVARDGPRVCEAVLRALSTDADLRRIESGGALEPLAARVGALAGAGSVAATSRAVQALGGVVWAALRAELPMTEAELAVELSERLSLVVETVRVAALSDAPGRPRVAPVPAPPPAEGPRARSSEAPASDPSGAPPAPDDAPVVSSTGEARIVPPTGEGLIGVAHGTTAGPSGVAYLAPSASEEPVAGALWKSALEDEITRAERGGTPLSLLLVELEEADRVRAIASPLEASSTFGRFAQAVRGAVRRQDILACETESRAWIIARDTGRLGAQALAARVVGAVGGMQPWRGAPMDVSVGLAMLREDGPDGQALIEAAEEARFAASASGAGFVAPPGARAGEPGVGPAGEPGMGPAGEPDPEP